jgi:hypothetical protein
MRISNPRIRRSENSTYAIGVLDPLWIAFTEPPAEATHWTGPGMVTDTGVSLRSVQPI